MKHEFEDLRELTPEQIMENLEQLEAENKRLKEEIIKPLLEGYCNVAGMLQTEFQFTGDQLTQKAEQALKGE